MSPIPSNRSPPIRSRMVRESMRLATLKQILAGMFDLISPVTTSTLGRWVARITWIPTARDFCAKRMMEVSTSLALVIIRSASSSMMMTR